MACVCPSSLSPFRRLCACCASCAGVGCHGTRCAPQSLVHLAGGRSALEYRPRWLLCVPLCRAALGFMTLRFNLQLLYACWHEHARRLAPSIQADHGARSGWENNVFQAPPLPSTHSGQPPPPKPRPQSARALVRTCCSFVYRVLVCCTRTWPFALTIIMIVRIVIECFS